VTVKQLAHRLEVSPCTTWDVLKTGETIEVVHVCRVERLLINQPQPLPFSRSASRVLGLS